MAPWFRVILKRPALRRRMGTWPSIDVIAVPEGKTIKNRLHFDLPADGVSTSEELERRLALGAQTWARARKSVGWYSVIPRATSSACCPDPSRTSKIKVEWCRTGLEKPHG